MKITKSQLRKIIREELTLNQHGDSEWQNIGQGLYARFTTRVAGYPEGAIEIDSGEDRIFLAADEVRALAHFVNNNNL